MSRCHPCLGAGAANGGSQGPGFRWSWRLGSPLSLVVGSFLVPGPQVGVGCGVAEAPRATAVQAGTVRP